MVDKHKALWERLLIACPIGSPLGVTAARTGNWSESKETPPPLPPRPFIARPSLSARAAFPNDAESLGRAKNLSALWIRYLDELRLEQPGQMRVIRQ